MYILVNKIANTFEEFASKLEAANKAREIIQDTHKKGERAELAISLHKPRTVALRVSVCVGNVTAVSEGKIRGRKRGPAPRDAAGRPLRKDGTPYNFKARNEEKISLGGSVAENQGYGEEIYVNNIQ